MSSYSQLIDGLRVAKGAAASLATPSASTDGISLVGSTANWRTLSIPKSFVTALVALSADGAATITSPKLYGYAPLISSTSGWFLIGDLNSGTALSLTATIGYAQVFQFPSCFTRLCVGGTVSANNVNYAATPIMVENQ